MIVGSNILAGASGQQGYFLNRSVRLRSSASAYFSRTPSVASNQQKFTFSCWVKISSISTEMMLFDAGTGNAADFRLVLLATGSLGVISFNGSVYTTRIETSAVLRDPSAWYHLVFSIDTTQATASNRVLIYINGVLQTALSQTTYMAQNFSTYINSVVLHTIGRYSWVASSPLDGYLTEINFIDGQQLTPTSFGAFNTITGVWQPIKYSGTYGTNGFYLNFNDNSAATAAAIGKDSSGNGNNWTPNNISLTAGTTYDSMTDVPTLTSVTQGNYCTLNPLNSSMVPTSGNLNLEPTGTLGNYISASTLGISTGKWYYEIVATTYTGSGQAGEFGFKLSSASSQTIGTGVGDANGFAFGMALATTWYYQKYGGAVVQLTGLTSATTGTIAMVAVDFDAGLAWVGKDGTWYNSGNPATGANPTITGITAGNYVATIAAYRDATRNYSYAVNFGQRPFTYTPPTGFVALNTYNLPAPTIANGANQFAATTYTGTGASLPITNTVNGVSMQPDFVWLKSRSNATNNDLTDSVRGLTKVLYSESTSAEVTITDNLTSLNSNGFTIAANSTFNTINVSPRTYIAWQWKASNAAAVSNTAGSISSQVSANPSAGFSIVTYTGTGANATVGHGLGIAPSMIIVKCRNTAATGWLTYVRPLTATSFLQLETTNAVASNITAWNNTTPTSSVFTVGTSAFCNGNTQTYVAYCFSEITGYSKISSYTGNSSTDGTFVYCGFRPRFILIKNSTSATAWAIFDTSRNTYNVTNNLLQAQSSGAESSYPEIDILSNGFKLRGTNGTWNTSANTYIYMAFAENPFNYSLAR